MKSYILALIITVLFFIINNKETYATIYILSASAPTCTNIWYKHVF